MGRTLPSITQAFHREQQSLSHLLPFEVMLLAMLVEEHKQVIHLRQEIDVLQAALEEQGPSAER
jgi:hypothetical protein